MEELAKFLKDVKVFFVIAEFEDGSSNSTCFGEGDIRILFFEMDLLKWRISRKIDGIECEEPDGA